MRRREPGWPMGGHQQPRRRWDQDLGGGEWETREGTPLREYLPGRVQPGWTLAGDVRDGGGQALECRFLDGRFRGRLGGKSKRPLLTGWTAPDGFRSRR